MSNELSIPKTVLCPADVARLPATRWDSIDNQNVSYFVGPDAQDTRPNMLLAGDRNMTLAGKLISGIVSPGASAPVSWTAREIHRGHGNVGLADGSVQPMTTELLRQQLANSGDTTNRLVFPQ
jgi:prepilin-type processing-associated H-X9-DG protein